MYIPSINAQTSNKCSKPWFARNKCYKGFFRIYIYISLRIRTFPPWQESDPTSSQGSVPEPNPLCLRPYLFDPLTKRCSEASAWARSKKKRTVFVTWQASQIRFRAKKVTEAHYSDPDAPKDAFPKSGIAHGPISRMEGSELGPCILATRASITGVEFGQEIKCSHQSKCLFSIAIG